MELSIVDSIDERLERLGVIKGQGYFLNQHTGVFYATLRGLDECNGTRVLEIGGAVPSFQEFFTRHGADYHNIRLEPPDEDEEGKDFIEVCNYMDLDPARSFDLIISYGVFERSAIDRQLMIGEGYRDWMYTNAQRLEKLRSLTLEGGFVVIGTGITNKCLFTEAEMRSGGFDLVGRVDHFYKPDSWQYPRGVQVLTDNSELYLLRNPIKTQ